MNSMPLVSMSPNCSGTSNAEKICD